MLGMSVSTGHGLSGPIYRVEQVPEHFQEHFILRGYRHPKSSVTQCLLSVFDPTNETLNVWTHFLPAWYFVWVLYYLSGSTDFLNDQYTWPLFCYLLVCCAFPLASAVAHLFNVLSDRARHVCFFLDYSALALFSFGVAVTYRAYCFPAGLLREGSPFAWYRDNYVFVAAFNAMLCTFCSCQTRFMKPSPFRKAMRLGSFAFPYLYDSVPIVYRLLHSTPEDSSSLTAHYFFTRQFFLSFLAAFLYASHLPERLVPGIFDIVGHSHQLFHVASIMAVWDQLQAVLADFEERREFVQKHWQFELAKNSILFVLVVFWINLFIVAYFTIKLFQLKHKLKSS
ncbi:membrane progestin receptor gamma [Aplysia californica]|uniref:Membrane progestin receptor gamma n=1 Tax=Aplysia californica TaxID=6500 RepID=A0ABM0JWK2_APLCA|nr:membrane progestin receptor gamma [Aplysia californica]